MMRTRRRHQIWGVITVLTLAILACNFVTGERLVEAPTLAVTVPMDTLPSVDPTMTEAPSDEPATTQPTLDLTEAEDTIEPTQTVPPRDTLAIKNLNAYQDRFNNWYVVGLIINNTDQTLENVEVQVQVTDISGQSLFSEITSASLFTLAPDETSPFRLDIFEDLPEADDFSAVIVGQKTAEVTRPQIETRNTSMIQDDDGDFHVNGEIYNPNEEPIQINGLAAATFRQDDNLITADLFNVSIQYLDPGESGPFRITMIGPGEAGEDATSYEVYTDVEFTSPEEEYDIIFSDIHNNYLDNYDSFHLVGEVTNNTEMNLGISLVAAIYNAEGDVIDASTQDVVVPLSPGETLPYDFDTWGPMNYFSNAMEAADTYTVQWDPYWTWESSLEYVDLTTQNDTNEFDQFQGIFTGEVINNSGGLVNSATIVVAIYDKDSGDIVATNYDALLEEFPKGAQVEYEIFITLGPNFYIDNIEYVILAKGELP